MNTGKTTKWIPLDIDSLDDPKIMALVQALGLEGYGIYLMLIQYLAKQEENYSLSFDFIKSLAYRNHTPEDKLRAVINSFGLFEIDPENNSFCSSSLKRRMQAYEKRIATKRDNALRGWETRKNAVTLQPHCDRNEEKIREDKIREEKNRIEKRHESFSLAVNSYSNVYPVSMLKAFIEYWTEKNKSGTKMRFEIEKTFEIPKRLTTWASREKDFGTQKSTDRPMIY